MSESGRRPDQSVDLDIIYRAALSEYRCSGPNAVLEFVRVEDARVMDLRAVRSGRDPYSMLTGGRTGLSRVYGPGASGLLPITGMIGSGISETASEALQRIMGASDAFFRGLGVGLTSTLSSEHYSRFAEKLGDSAILSSVFPVVFGAGAAAGVIKDVVDAVKGIIDLVGNIRNIAEALFDLVEQMLKDPAIAHDLGKQVGIHLGEKFKSLLGKNVIEFTFELGKIVGPFIIYSLLAFFGVPLGAVVGVRIGTWIGQFLKRFPKLMRAVEGIRRMLPRIEAFVLYGRATKAWIKKSGMPLDHFNAFKQVAKEQDVIVIVRNTNNKSLQLIEKYKCPPKGKNLENIGSTSDRTGIVMAKDVQKVRQAGYAVVDADLVPRGPNGQALDLPPPFWKLEKGQVLDLKSKKPIVGDYDLMGVLDPKAPGRNIALATKNGENVADVSSPVVDNFKRSVNLKLDQPRVLHGAQDQYKGFRGGATVIYPDGNATYLPDEGAVKAFYESPSILRKTRDGKYPVGQTPEFDEHGKWENVQQLRPGQ